MSAGPGADSPPLATPPAPAPLPVAPRGRGLERAGVAVVLALLAVVGVALTRPEVRTRLWVVWLARGLDSPDPMARTQARQDLLDMGRPRIDMAFPRLVASEVADELVGQASAAVLVGSRGPTLIGSPFAPQAFDVDGPPLCVTPEFQPWLGGGLRPGVWERQWIEDAIVCPTAKRLVKEGAARELVLVVAVHRDGGPHSGALVRELRVAVPLDDDLAPEILDAVRARLAQHP